MQHQRSPCVSDRRLPGREQANATRVRRKKPRAVTIEDRRQTPGECALWRSTATPLPTPRTGCRLFTLLLEHAARERQAAPEDALDATPDDAWEEAWEEARAELSLTIMSLAEASHRSWRLWQASACPRLDRGEPSTACRTAPSSPTPAGSRPASTSTSSGSETGSQLPPLRRRQRQKPPRGLEGPHQPLGLTQLRGLR